MSEPSPGWKPDLYVLARLLEHLWRRNGPMLKTRLQVAANVNYDLFSRYLNWMVVKGLVVLQDDPDGHEQVSLTAKGGDAYRKLVQWIYEVVLGRTPSA
jgi:predicted transcriptional regulator